MLIRLGTQATPAANQALQHRVEQVLQQAQPGTRVIRNDVVGASVSAELLQNGVLALVISLAMIFAYIWFRFEWQFAVGAVVTLLLDVTKTTRVPGADPHRVRQRDGGGHPDHHRLLHQRQGGRVRPGAREFAQIQDRCRCAT